MFKIFSKTKQLVNHCTTLANNGVSFIRKPTNTLSKISINSLKYDKTTLSSMRLQPTKNSDEISEYFFEFMRNSANPSKLKFKRPSVKTSLHMNAAAFEGFCHSINSKIKVVKNYNGNICGGYSSNVENSTLYISSLYLRPQAKTKNLTLDLLKDIKTTAQQNGCTSIVCETGYVKEFQKLGFEKVKQKGFMNFLQWVTKLKSMSCPTESFATRYLG